MHGIPIIIKRHHQMLVTRFKRYAMMVKRICYSSFRVSSLALCGHILFSQGQYNFSMKHTRQIAALWNCNSRAFSSHINSIILFTAPYLSLEKAKATQIARHGERNWLGEVGTCSNDRNAHNLHILYNSFFGVSLSLSWSVDPIYGVMAGEKGMNRNRGSTIQQRAVQTSTTTSSTARIMTATHETTE